MSALEVMLCDMLSYSYFVKLVNNVEYCIVMNEDIIGKMN